MSDYKFYFEDDINDDNSFYVKAKNSTEAFNRALESYGPQVNDMVCKLSNDRARSFIKPNDPDGTDKAKDYLCKFAKLRFYSKKDGYIRRHLAGDFAVDITNLIDELVETGVINFELQINDKIRKIEESAIRDFANAINENSIQDSEGFEHDAVDIAEVYIKKELITPPKETK